jgi:hypothetical protein
LSTYDMAVAFAGYGDASQVSIRGLLDDYLPDEVLAVVPWYNEEDNPGLSKIVRFLNDVGIEIIPVPADNLLSTVSSKSASRHELIVTGPEKIEGLIFRAQELGWRVSDLTRGLFSIRTASQMPPDGSESKSQAVSDAPGTPVRGEAQNGSESRAEADGRTDLTAGWNADDPPWSVAAGDQVMHVTRDEVYQIVAGLIQVHEAQYHGKGTVKENPETLPGYLDKASPDVVPSVPQVSDTTEVKKGIDGTMTVHAEQEDGTIKYYSNNSKGTYRKAGTSRRRPSETVVWIPSEDESKVPAE